MYGLQVYHTTNTLISNIGDSGGSSEAWRVGGAAEAGGSAKPASAKRALGKRFPERKRDPSLLPNPV